MIVFKQSSPCPGGSWVPLKGSYGVMGSSTDDRSSGALGPLSTFNRHLTGLTCWEPIADYVWAKRPAVGKHLKSTGLGAKKHVLQASKEEQVWMRKTVLGRQQHSDAVMPSWHSFTLFTKAGPKKSKVSRKVRAEKDYNAPCLLMWNLSKPTTPGWV